MASSSLRTRRASVSLRVTRLYGPERGYFEASRDSQFFLMHPVSGQIGLPFNSQFGNTGINVDRNGGQITR
jgi:hypothetical protein